MRTEIEMPIKKKYLKLVRKRILHDHMASRQISNKNINTGELYVTLMKYPNEPTLKAETIT